MHHETDVFDELERLRREMDRLFERLTPTSHRVPAFVGRNFRPPTDVYQTEDHTQVKVEVAGADPDSLQVSLDGQDLVIAGARQDVANKRAYQQMEISWGEFRTEVTLSDSVDPDRVTAAYEDGFLTVTLPKGQGRARRIEIKPGRRPAY